MSRVDIARARYEPSAEDLRNLREWIAKVPYLPQDLEDHILRLFYGVSKGSMERTKKRIDAFYEGRVRYPELVKGLNVLSQEIQNVLNSTIILPLRKKTEDDCTVFVCMLRDFDPDKYDDLGCFRTLCMVFKYCMMTNELGLGRLAIIIDGKGFSAKHALKISAKDLHSKAKFLSTGGPYFPVGIHLVKLPQVVRSSLSLVKSLINAKVAQRFHLHKDETELLEHFPRKILPADYGGDELPLAELYDEFKEKLVSFAQAFEEDEIKLRKIDLLRPKIDDDILAGSFRKLECD